MKRKLIALLLAGLIGLGSAGAAAAAEKVGTSGGPPNPSGQCPPGNSPGCSPIIKH